MQQKTILAALLALVLAACSSAPPPRTAPPAPSGSEPTPVAETPSPASSPGEPNPQTSEPGEAGTISPVSAGQLPHSWRPGCPVPVEDLRLLSVGYWGFDGVVHRGELVVHRDQAEQVLQVMQRLLDGRFPIERMVLVDAYEGDDDLSVEANNTSAFNCRRVAGSNVWSQHAFGRAIDINPIQNPYVSGSGLIESPGGRAFADRSDVRPGMIVAGDQVVQAFASIGWGWGGNFRNSKDYQHFSESGR